MTDLDQRISDVLRERAEGETDTHRLLRASRALGRRRQVRRRVAAGTALALVGVVAFAGVNASDGGRLTGRLPWTAATPTAPAPVPPRADGVPGAAADPTRVGTDPRVLHFGVDPARARYLGWGVDAGQVESIRFEAAGGRRVLVEVARSETTFRNLGIEAFQEGVPRPAAFDGSIQRVAAGNGNFGFVTWWQPAAGLFARASMLGGDAIALPRYLAALRWDEARRCAAPVRLDALPAGATINSCQVDLSSYPELITAQLSVGGNEEQYMAVRYRYAVQAGTSNKSNRTVGGRPAYVAPNGWTIDLVGIPKVELTATFGWPGQGFTEADAGALLGGARLAEDPTRLQTWP
ncbi:hypothetical protein [Micromonospora sp. NPDC005707]|uniref:hypothetical protein n=1 Tax=Micromonospora sp. NPDC005707 TaxID=3157050 RepID=UPI00340CCE0D